MKKKDLGLCLDQFDEFGAATKEFFRRVIQRYVSLNLPEINPLGSSLVIQYAEAKFQPRKSRLFRSSISYCQILQAKVATKARKQVHVSGRFIQTSILAWVGAKSLEQSLLPNSSENILDRVGTILKNNAIIFIPFGRDFGKVDFGRDLIREHSGQVSYTLIIGPSGNSANNS